MSENHRNRPDPAPEADSAARSSRRRLLKAGAVAVPSILTLHASPVWAGTDYTRNAYTYGINAGKCSNPNFNRDADPTGEEFISCPDPGTDGRLGGPSAGDAAEPNGDRPVTIQID